MAAGTEEDHGGGKQEGRQEREELNNDREPLANLWKNYFTMFYLFFLSNLLLHVVDFHLGIFRFLNQLDC